MLGRDQRLQEVRRGRGAGERAQQPDRLGDLVGVPAGTVLVGEEHELAVVAGAGIPAGVLEQHQRQQGVELGIRRAQLPDSRTRRTASPARSARTTSAPEAGRSRP